MLLLWEVYGPGVPEHWGRAPWIAIPALAAAGWIVWFVLTMP